jgi:hypothetical protein
MKKKKKTDIFKRKKIKEEDFLKVLDDISKKLIYKFKFGYHEIEDMKQQAAIFALQGLENYDNSRPLANFLWTHVRNRLFNFKRDNYFRPDNVCIGCPFFDPQYKKSANQCSKFKDKMQCSIYSEWTDKNQIKKNIMHPSSINDQTNTLHNDNNISDNISNNEIINIIENKIHTKYRETYLKIKGGAKVSKTETIKLKRHIEKILKEHKND